MNVTGRADGANGFDPDFAGPQQWAEMYRHHGFQVVPAWSPAEHKQWKRPRLAEWRKIQNELIPQTDFDRIWSENARRRNMGLITGPCSGNLFIVDLDTQKTPAAALWWSGLLAVHNNAMPLETCEQRTGGGGRQLLFRAPPGVVVPTCKTARGVDIRGHGGFAMLPPSMHESGVEYAWLPGQAPGEVDIAGAPVWLLDAIVDLVREHGGEKSRPPLGEQGGSRLSADPAIAVDPFGNVTDGREQVMRDVVWHAVLELYRESPIIPPERDWPKLMEGPYEEYERKVTTRVPGVSLREGLQQEYRGQNAFLGKWLAAMRRWGDEGFTRDANEPAPEQKSEFDTTPEQPEVDPQTGQPLPLLLTAEQFVAGFTPPAYVIDGILQRGYLYSLTARTGDGKTAVTMYIAQCVARGVPMHGCAVKSGTVLLLAGENPDDIRARYLVLAEQEGFEAERIRIRFIAGTINLPGRLDQIKAEAASIPDLMLIVVDTAAAYFPGDETNSNSQQGAYARLLRELTFLPGKPTVLVNCHPVKNAARDNLLPMGGSAFLNEVDGNLTLWAGSEKQVSLHWQGKMRGPEFDPIAFEIVTASSMRVADAEGRLMPSVIAKPISDSTMEAAETVQQDDEDKVLRALYASPDISAANMAHKLGFLFNGIPQKAKVQRIIRRLSDDKLVARYRGGKYRLTGKGEEAIGVKGDRDE